MTASGQNNSYLAKPSEAMRSLLCIFVATFLGEFDGETLTLLHETDMELNNAQCKDHAANNHLHAFQAHHPSWIFLRLPLRLFRINSNTLSAHLLHEVVPLKVRLHIVLLAMISSTSETG